MCKVTWRNLVARKVRLALSALRDRPRRRVRRRLVHLHRRARRGLRRHHQRHDGRRRGRARRVPATSTGAEDARTVPGVCWSTSSTALPGGGRGRRARNQVQGVFVIGKDGKLVGGNGPPGFAFNYTDTKAITGDQILTLSRRRPPRGRRPRSRSTRRRPTRPATTIGDEVTLVTPAASRRHEGRAHRTGEVRLRGRPGRGDPHDLRPPGDAGPVLRRPGRLHHDLA